MPRATHCVPAKIVAKDEKDIGSGLFVANDLPIESKHDRKTQEQDEYKWVSHTLMLTSK